MLILFGALSSLWSQDRDYPMGISEEEDELLEQMQQKSNGWISPCHGEGCGFESHLLLFKNSNY